jgi:hypothetical protein
MREVTAADRARFLLEYIDLLITERVREDQDPTGAGAARHDRWIINKLRALGAYYTKGFENGSQLRTAINTAQSLDRLRGLIEDFFTPAERRVLAS